MRLRRSAQRADADDAAPGVQKKSRQRRESWPPAIVTQIKAWLVRHGHIDGPPDSEVTPELEDVLARLLGRPARSMTARRVFARLRDLDDVPHRSAEPSGPTVARPDWGDIPYEQPEQVAEPELLDVADDDEATDRTETDDAIAAAIAGVAGIGEPLPFLDTIQSLFGKHDVGDIRAHSGSEARNGNAAMGSTAFALGMDVAFGDTPDLFTTAHEAVHVLQQRSGAAPDGGVGTPGDGFEQQADAVAQLVANGESAEALLDAIGTSNTGTNGFAVQHRSDTAVPATDAAAEWTRDQVRAMQQLLEKLVPDYSGVDGIRGPNTNAALTAALGGAGWRRSPADAVINRLRALAETSAAYNEARDRRAERRDMIPGLVERDELGRLPALPTPRPEGLERRVSEISMAADGPNRPNATMAPELNDIGRRHGFGIDVDTTSSTPWVEDTALHTEGGELLVPPPVSEHAGTAGGHAEIYPHGPIPDPPNTEEGTGRNLIFAQAKQEQLDLVETETGIEVPFDGSLQGMVDQAGQAWDPVRYGLDRDKTIHVTLGYLEGGNVLLGTRPGGETYAIVGRDSLTITEELLEAELSTPQRPLELTDEQVRIIVARDLGVTLQNLIVVDQPDFHIDMAVAPWTAGVVLVDDTRQTYPLLRLEISRFVRDSLPSPVPDTLPNRAAYQRLAQALESPTVGETPLPSQLGGEGAYAELLVQWHADASKVLDGLTKLGATAPARAVVEDHIAGELQAAGLRVIRVPGRFDQLHRLSILGNELPMANYVNGEGGTDPSGNRFYIALGDDTWKQEFLQALERNQALPDAVYFIGGQPAHESLGNWGGFNCRVQVSGERDDPPPSKD